MASADAFFQSPSWDPAEFDARMRRVPRKSRLRRHTDKAWALFYKSDGDPERQRAAIALIERGVDEPGADADEGAHALVTAAGYAVALGDRRAAIALAKRSIKLSSQPRLRGPVTAHELLARCLTDEGSAAARPAWKLAYLRRETETEGRWRLPEYDDLVARPIADTLDDLAEGIRIIYELPEPPEPAVPGIAAAGLAALDALDRHYREMKASCERRWAPRAVFDESYLLDSHLPQLGAFVGRVLVNAAGGRWQVGDPLLRSRVIVGERAVDPFLAAYDAIYFETSLADFVRAALR